MGFLGCLAAFFLAFMGSGCGGGGGREVVVYAAQDRVYAEPVLKDFEATAGIRVRAVYDNEATKTVGLANRLAAEAGRPMADVWWSNEEMRTRQLIRQGVLEEAPRIFGGRRRVLAWRTNDVGLLPAGRPGLGWLTNAALRGRTAMAFPLFGTTATHFLVLRSRLGAAPWETWCRALIENRPLVVDGNSLVVKLVANGQATVGWTDSDDVEAARREGIGLASAPLEGEEGLDIPNTVAVVRGARHREDAVPLIEYLAGPDVQRRLVEAGAVEKTSAEAGAKGPSVDWARVLGDLDVGVAWLRTHFLRER